MKGRGGGAVLVVCTLLVACGGTSRKSQPSTGGAGGQGGSTSAGGSGAVAPPHPLITGDPECPPGAPGAAGLDCSVSGVVCVYAGILAGISETDSPMRCECTSPSWSCVNSDATGETVCPLTEPGPGDPCDVPMSEQPCRYVTSGVFTIPSCYCNAATPSPWSCGL